MRCSQGTHRDSARGRRPTPAGHTGASFSVGLGWVDMQPRHRTPRDSGLPLMMPLLMPLLLASTHIHTCLCHKRLQQLHHRCRLDPLCIVDGHVAPAILQEHVGAGLDQQLHLRREGQGLVRSALAPALISSFTCDDACMHEEGRYTRAAGERCSAMQCRVWSGKEHVAAGLRCHVH